MSKKSLEYGEVSWGDGHLIDVGEFYLILQNGDHLYWSNAPALGSRAREFVQVLFLLDLVEIRLYDN